MNAGSSVYRPILPYQTRIILLHGNNGRPDAPIVCSLHVADILHPTFEGLALRYEEEEGLVQYDALSYTWGSQTNVSKEIMCNNTQLRVTDNLFDALNVLQYPGNKRRYLWVDAICIDQRNSEEKAIQVRHMLSIYQKATKVIAWLGKPHRNTCDMLFAATSFDREWNFAKVCAGLEDLYLRPWFQRIWVQQEIYGARRLTLQCGEYEFQWCELLSKPYLLTTLPHLQRYQKLLEKGMPERKRNHLKAKTPKIVRDQFKVISYLMDLHDYRLQCFEKYSKSNCPPFDLVDVIFQSGTLKATKPVDYIYGILGLAAFPAKAMSIQEWLTARQSEVFIPIDYSANLRSVLSTVTWATLMIGGLILLIHLKLRSPARNEQELPSWVIDWDLARTLLRRVEPTGLDIKLGNAWDARVPEILWRDLGMLCPTSAELPEYREFRDDNQDDVHDANKLILRGAIDTKYFAKGKIIWERGRLVDSRACNLSFDVFNTDLIVYLPASVRTHTIPGRITLPLEDYKITPGRWLLRPAGNNEYKLMACLMSRVFRGLTLDGFTLDGSILDGSLPANDYGLPYDYLQINPSSSQSIREAHQFAFLANVDYGHPRQNGEEVPLHKFIII